MSFPDQLALVICLRTDDSDVHTLGSLVDSCGDCGNSVWLSAETKQRVAGKPRKLVCVACSRKYVSDNSSIAAPTRAELEAIAKRVSDAQ